MKTLLFLFPLLFAVADVQTIIKEHIGKPIQEIRTGSPANGKQGDGSKVLPVQSGKFKDDENE